MGVAQQNLWRAVPSRAHVVRVRGTCVQFLCETKVRNFYCIVVNEEIFRLQIPVEIVLLVHVSKALQCLEEHVAYSCLRKKLSPFFHQLIDVHVEVLEDKVKGTALKYHLI